MYRCVDRRKLDNIIVRVSLISREVVAGTYKEGPKYEDFDVTFKPELLTKENDPHPYVMYTCTIPKHIFDIVKDRDIETTKPNSFGRDRTITGIVMKKGGETAKNILKGRDIQKLCEELSELGHNAYCILEFEKLHGGMGEDKKFLFFEYSSSSQRGRSSFNHADSGHTITSKLRWGVVYSRSAKGGWGSKYYYANHDGSLDGLARVRWHNRMTAYPEEKFSREEAIRSDLGNVTIIEWTQEREDFLRTLQDGFNTLKDRLDSFLGEIKDTKALDMLMSNCDASRLLDAPEKAND